MAWWLHLALNAHFRDCSVYTLYETEDQLVITTVIHSSWLQHASKEAYSSSLYLDSGTLEIA